MEIQEIVLASRPVGLPSSDNFRPERKVLEKITEGEVLLKPLYFSVDPYMRGRMSSVKSYAAGYEVDKPILGGTVAKVIESKSPDLSEGDSVVGTLPWATCCIERPKNLKKINTDLFPAPYYLGVLRMPGLTAYFGMMDIGRPVKGDTVLISGAAGAVGIVAGQIAKIRGAIVTGITGSDEKCRMLREQFGFDSAINYKATKALRKEIAAECPKGVDIYFDNVGGEITDAAVANLNFRSRFVLCGQISQYNNTRISTGPALLPVLLTRSVTLQGFIVSNFSDRFDEAMSELTGWVSNGSLKYTETVIEGFNNLPQAFIGLFNGMNYGKMLVKAD